MATKVTVELPDNIYQRAQEFARLHQQKVEEAIPALIEQGLAAGGTEAEIIDRTKPNPVVQRERDAYFKLHPQLKEQYLGKYVAIYQGKMIDHDDEPAALFGRVQKQHPNEFVLVTQVHQEPIRTIVVRSPRIVRDKVL